MYVKYIVLEKEVTFDDIYRAKDIVNDLTTDQCIILYSLIKDYKSLKSSKTSVSMELAEGDLFRLDDRKSLEIKSFIKNLANKAIETLLIPLIGSRHNSNNELTSNIRSLFLIKIDGKLIIGTTDSYGSTKILNDGHMYLIFIEKLNLIEGV